MKLLVKNVLFTLVIPGTVGVYIPLILARGLSGNLRLPLLISLAFFGFASAIYIWSVWNFAARGRGTPLPIDAPRKLVIQGPYQYTRNPMYVALLAALLGWTILYQSIGIFLYTLALGAAVSIFVLRYEEPHLQREFGADYENYKAKVPRWLPRLPRSPDA